MKLEEVYELWSKDCEIDQTNISNERKYSKNSTTSITLSIFKKALSIKNLKLT